MQNLRQINAKFTQILKFYALNLNSPRKAAVCFKACLAAEKSAALAALTSAEKSASAASRLGVLLLCLIEAIDASGVGARAFVGGLTLALVGWVVKQLAADPRADDRARSACQDRFAQAHAAATKLRVLVG